MLAVLGQVLTAVLAAVCLGEILTPGSWFGIGLVIAGVTTVLHGCMAGEEGRTRREGVIFGLLAVGCMSASNIVAKAGLAEQGETIQATFIRMLAGTVGVLGYGLATNRLEGWVSPFRDKRLLAGFVGSVAVVTFGGFWLGMVAFKHTSVAIASSLTSTEPIFALILAALILKERVRLSAVGGTATVILGVVVLCTG